MKYVSVHAAKDAISPSFLREAAAGEDIVITRSGRPVAKLVSVEEERPIFGIDKGRFVVPDDFDAPLDEKSPARVSACGSAAGGKHREWRRCRSSTAP